MKNNSERLLNSVSLLIKESRNLIVRNVNTTMVYTYFHIGRMIVEENQQGQDRAAYSESVLKELSGHLTKEYGRGFSHRNLEYFRKFYLSYTNRISQSMIAKSDPYNQHFINSQSLPAFSEHFKLSWTHYVQLMKIENIEERDFYEIESASNNWSVRELQRQYDSSVYERLALSKDNQGIKQLSSIGQVLEKPFDTLKSPYVLEFLNPKEDSTYSENDLESAIIDKLEHFMMELGKGFLFEGRQKRITFRWRSFFC